MKKIRFVNGRFIAFIHQEDVSTLLNIKSSVNPVVFREESIITGSCDEEGYYQIEGKEAVKYLQSLPYIPDYDTLDGMDTDALKALADKAMANRRLLKRVLTRLCDDKEPIDMSDRIALLSMEEVDHSLIEALERNVLEASLQSIRFRDIAHVISEQSRNYTNAILKMANIKEQETKSNVKKKKKNSVVRRLFGKRTATRS